MSSASEFIRLYHSLFMGNPEVYAVRLEWDENSPEGEKIKRSAYIPSKYNGKKESTRQRMADITADIGDSGFSEKAVEAHLRGKYFLGVYPLLPDSTVNFFALDFDGDSPEEAWKEASRHYLILWRANLEVYIERSQSGNGWHIWGFLATPVHAKTVRRAIKQFIEKSDTFDRMFPNQNGVTELRPLGNLIALPLHGPRVKEGKSCFVNWSQDGPVEVSDQKDFIRNIVKIEADIIEQLASEAPELKEERVAKARVGAADGSLPGVNKVIDPRFGCEWVRWHIEYPEEVTEPEWYALACNLAQLRGGRDVFHEISSLSARYSADQTDDKFDHAMEMNAPHPCEYIRENLKGPKCNCDKRFPGKVFHPYGIGKIPIYELIKSIEASGEVQEAEEGFSNVIEWLAEVEKDPTVGWGLTTGIEAVDEHIGFRDATLNILAARPSIGKTAICLDFAYRMASSGIPVYFFSLEMSAKQLWLRLLSRVAGISDEKMRKGKLDFHDWKRISEAKKGIAALPSFPLFVDDSTRDIRWIMEKAWDLQEQNGKGIVIIDYLGLLEWQQGENEYAATTRNSKECKLLAKALDCPNLVLHQFNRSGDDMGVDAQTFDSWLRSSGQIEQDADVILYLLGERGAGIKERMLVKQKDRDGEAGIRIPLEFNQQIMQFGGQGTWLKGINGAQVNFSAATSVMGTNDGELPWEDLDESE